MTKDSLTLKAGSLSLGLEPSIGGAVSHLRYGDLEILRPMPQDAILKGLVRKSSSYPLIPYSGRIGHGKLDWQGEQYQLTLNFGDHPHSIHGNGWQLPWQVELQDSSQVILVQKHQPFGFGPNGWDGWPFRYTARQFFEITENTVKFKLEITNDDEAAFPVGLGWHPYFTRHKDMQLQFSAEEVWYNGDDMLPSHKTAIPDEWDYAHLRTLDKLQLDNIFSRWHGLAKLRLPNERLDIILTASKDCSYLVVFTPPDRPVIAVEPVSHLANGVNMLSQKQEHGDKQDFGVKTIKPGEHFQIDFQIAINAF